MFELLSNSTRRRVNALYGTLPAPPVEISPEVQETMELVQMLSDSQWGKGGGNIIARILSGTDEDYTPYNVQCQYGRHVFTAPRGSNLEQECITRFNKGYRDALPVSSDECPECLYEREQRERRNREYDFWIAPFNLTSEE